MISGEGFDAARYTHSRRIPLAFGDRGRLQFPHLPGPRSGSRPMLRVLGRPRRFCDGVTRREAMTVGALSVLGGGFNLPTLLASEERKPATAKAKNVFVIYLHGGAPIGRAHV